MSFVTQKDYDILGKNDIDFKSFHSVFLKELKNILLSIWRTEFHKDLENLESSILEMTNNLHN